jgi:tetratricopeptide (TPR) repeat protein
MNIAGMGFMRRKILASLACCAGLFFGASPCARAQQAESPAAIHELSLKEYEAELDRCSAALKQPSELGPLRSSLPASWRVRTGETVTEVSTAPIGGKLREMQVHPDKSEKITGELNLRLEAMQRAAAEAEGENPGDGASAKEERGRLEKILSRKEFQSAKGPSAWDLLQARINRWLFEHLQRLFAGLHIDAKTGNALAWGVMGLAVLALVYMVWSWLSGKSRPLETEPEKVKVPSDARQWVQEALAAAERGDYREAVHCAYWAAVAKLEDLNVLARDRTRTPRESLRLLIDHPSEEELLRAMTGHFELIWYGYRPASANDWSGAREQLEKMGCLKASTAPTANS